MSTWSCISWAVIVLMAMLVMPMMGEMPQPLPRVNLIHPICTKQAGKRYNYDKHVSIEVKSIRNYPTCPCAIDINGKCRFAEHMCFGANTTFLCTLHMKGLTITSWGALIEGDRKSRDVISLGDNSFAGGHAPQYWPEANAVIYRGIELALQRFKPVNSLIPTKDIVIPTRMRWDDCFNHLSFQSLPLIGLVHEYQPHLFYTSYWHTSRFTAAILLLLGVEYQRLIIETSVAATTAVLPWIPHWSPFDTAPIRGIARNVSLLATQSLLSRKITLAKNSAVATLIPMNHLYEPISLNFNEKERYVVYFNRSSGGKRTVDNEGELLAAIHNMLLPSYRLVVLPPVKEYKKLHQIHAVWQQYARIVNRAAVLIGPHGGGLNNMMWAPDDCDMIEFNEIGDEAHYTESYGKIPVRRVFLNGFWARSGPNSKYYVISAVKKHPTDFYEGSMTIDVEHVQKIFSLVQNGRLIRSAT